MEYLDYKESRRHGTIHFPFGHYLVTSLHPRYHMMFHWHPEYEIIRILSGTLTLQLDEKTIVGSKGDIFFISGGSLHRGEPDKCRYECLVFDMNYFLNESRACYKELTSIVHQNKIIQPFFPATDSEVKETTDRIFHALSARKKGYELLVQGSVDYFLGLILQNHYYQEDVRLPDRIKRIRQFKSVLHFIRQHYSENITLKTLSELVHMNPNYFCRFFSSITQQTPMQYLNYYRIECACEKLVSSDKSISEIAYDCGFNDTSYFIKVFKKYKSMTPSQFLHNALPEYS